MSSLLQMEKNAAAGRTTSVAMPTPPPAALNISSPKFAPMSPVHTNPLNEAKSVNTQGEPTNFSLPPSCTEGDMTVNAVTSRGPISDQPESRQHLGDSRNDRFTSEGLLILRSIFSFLRISLD